MAADPFEFPLSIIPKGMVYQWCTRTVLGNPDPSFTAMVEGGWMPVPVHRHPKVFTRRVDIDGNVAVGGQVLMCRLEEVSQEAQAINEDAAYRNAGAAARLVKLGDIPFHLSSEDAASAHDLGISCQQYALRRMKRMADGFDRNTRIRGDIESPYGPTGFLEFCATRQSRYRWLCWLFNLISKEV